MSMRIDLNADMGEGMGDDAALLEIVSSASIACGGHAGDRETMVRLFGLCAEKGVRIGAHPGFADPAHFGRRRLEIGAETAAAQVVEQLALAREVARETGTGIGYLKLHGALANMAAEDAELAETVFAAVAGEMPGLPILALANSAQARAGGRLGLPVIAEAYADRAYMADGLLADRSRPGAVITASDAVVAQCVALATRQGVATLDGGRIALVAHSICVHGDTPGAVALARAVRQALEAAGIGIGAD